MIDYEQIAQESAFWIVRLIFNDGCGNKEHQD